MLSPIGLLDTPLLKKLLPGHIPRNLGKFYIFPGESSSPHRGTETGCHKEIVSVCTRTQKGSYLESQQLTSENTSLQKIKVLSFRNKLAQRNFFKTSNCLSGDVFYNHCASIGMSNGSMFKRFKSIEIYIKRHGDFEKLCLEDT